MAQFQLSEKEFVKASLMLSLKRPLRTFILLSIALALIAVSQVFGGRSPGNALAFFLIAIILFTGITYLLSVQRLKKAFREQATLQQPIDLTIDEQQLNYAWPRGTAVFLWSDIRRWKETSDFFLLFESDLFARILPKRALSESEVAIIRRKIESLPRI